MSEILDFDPALREIVFRATGRPAGAPIPEDLAARPIPVLARLTEAAPDIAGLEVVARFGDVVTARAPLGRLVEVRRHPCVASLKAGTSCTPTLLGASVAHIRANPEILSRTARHGLTGRGMVVAVIDWGCDFAHPNFRDRRGHTRMLAIWDQRPALGPSSPSPYGYGRVIERAEIDAALDESDPYEGLGYDPGEADYDSTGTHGTHVLDIAAGSGLAPDAARGVAPEAELLFVHLRGDDTRPEETLGDSVRLVEAVRWVLDRAGARPVVINMSLGRTGGPHDGTTLVERALDAALAEQPGRAIVMSTGNYFSAGMHSHGRLQRGERADLRFYVPGGVRGTTELEVWYPGSDELLVELIDPAGRRVARVGLGEESIVRRDDVTLATVYHRRRDPNNGDHQIDIFLRPEAAAGTWILRLEARRARAGVYHAWIERTASYHQARFLPADATRESTTNTVCNGRSTIAVGAYDIRLAGSPMARFSSAGPTRDGRRKPDIVAPGAGIVAARSTSPYDDVELLVEKSGTSMAAPHVTGTVALIFEAAMPRRLTIDETRDVLLGTARPVPAVHPLDPLRAGAGRVDAAAAVAAVRRLVAESEDDTRTHGGRGMTRRWTIQEQSAANALVWLRESADDDVGEQVSPEAWWNDILGMNRWMGTQGYQGLTRNPVVAGGGRVRVPSPAITFVPADRSNYHVSSRTAANIDTIVFHTIEGSARAAIAWFQNPSSNVSAHFVVSSAGVITQMMDIKDVAWTQTYYNRRAIGIECEGYAHRADTWTESMKRALAHLTAWLCQEYGIAASHPDGRATANTSAGRFNRAGLVGHEQIQPWNKSDPGPYFDWARLVRDVGDWLSGRRPESDARTPGASGSPPGQGTVGQHRNGDLFRVSKGQLTFDLEGQEGGRYHSRVAHVPPGEYSGVTIGRGYDLGQRSPSEIRAHMTRAGLSQEHAERFAGAAGRRGEAARGWLEVNQGHLPEITPMQQRALFEIVYEEMERDVRRISDNYASYHAQRTGRPVHALNIDWNRVHPAIRDILVDLRYRGDYRTKTRQRVQPPAIANDLRALYEAMRDRDYWVGSFGVPEHRFTERVRHLERALGRQ